jgi:hypothetical protein
MMRAKVVPAPSWLLMISPHDDVTAPLAQWTAAAKRAAADDPGEDRPLHIIFFFSENACNNYRTCLYGGCIEPFTVVQGGVFGSSDVRARADAKKTSGVALRPGG